MGLLRKKQFWHGMLFLLTGLFMYGRYVIIGENIPTASESPGPFVALLLMGFSVYLFFFGEGFLHRRTIVLEYYEAIVMAVGIALFVRTFAVEPFKIPSGSMIPTLLVGDFLFVNKNAYGYRVPFTRIRVFFSEPERGDVAVFEFPDDPTKDYIKRIVGLPGDRVKYQNKRLYINGEASKYQPLGEFSYKNESGSLISAGHWQETVAGVDHAILLNGYPPQFPGREWLVPEGHYFALGDNRDNSNDSRFWGFVPRHRLVGQAVRLLWSWDGQEWRVRWERLWEPIL